MHVRACRIPGWTRRATCAPELFPYRSSDNIEQPANRVLVLRYRIEIGDVDGPPLVRIVAGQIAWDYLERTGEIEDPEVCSRVLMDSVELMVRQGVRIACCCRIGPSRITCATWKPPRFKPHLRGPREDDGTENRYRYSAPEWDWLAVCQMARLLSDQEMPRNGERSGPKGPKS